MFSGLPDPERQAHDRPGDDRTWLEKKIWIDVDDAIVIMYVVYVHRGVQWTYWISPKGEIECLKSFKHL